MAATSRVPSDFAQALATHVALSHAIRANAYRSAPHLKKAAEHLLREIEGDRSTSGRQIRMLGQLSKGAGLNDICRKLRCSRRTVFRYLNQLEEAGVSITLENNKYRADASLLQMLGSR